MRGRARPGRRWPDASHARPLGAPSSRRSADQAADRPRGGPTGPRGHHPSSGGRRHETLTHTAPAMTASANAGRPGAPARARAPAPHDQHDHDHEQQDAKHDDRTSSEVRAPHPLPVPASPVLSWATTPSSMQFFRPATVFNVPVTLPLVRDGPAVVADPSRLHVMLTAQPDPAHRLAPRPARASVPSRPWRRPGRCSSYYQQRPSSPPPPPTPGPGVGTPPPSPTVSSPRPRLSTHGPRAQTAHSPGPRRPRVPPLRADQLNHADRPATARPAEART